MSMSVLRYAIPLAALCLALLAATAARPEGSEPFPSLLDIPVERLLAPPAPTPLRQRGPGRPEVLPRRA